MRNSYIAVLIVSDNTVAENFEQTINLDPKKVQKQFDRIGRFRILVVGRSNAGKTTLLQRVCKTTELPEIYNSNGEKVKYFIVQRHRSLMPCNSQLDKIVCGSLEASEKLNCNADILIIMFRGGNMTSKTN